MHRDNASMTDKVKLPAEDRGTAGESAGKRACVHGLAPRSSVRKDKRTLSKCTPLATEGCRNSIYRDAGDQCTCFPTPYTFKKLMEILIFIFARGLSMPVVRRSLKRRSKTGLPYQNGTQTIKESQAAPHSPKHHEFQSTPHTAILHVMVQWIDVAVRDWVDDNRDGFSPHPPFSK